MRPVLSAIPLLLAAGCIHPVTADPTVAMPLPPRYTAAEEPSARGEREEPASALDEDGWWRRYDDPALHGLIERALENSYTLRARFAAVRQAEGLRRQAAAARWPTVSAIGNVGRNRSVGFFGANNADRVDLSLPISYEVDLFARFAGEERARTDEVRASELDMQSAAISLSAEVAEAWYDLVNARARLAALQAQLETNETYLELVQLRFQRGVGEVLDVHQQRQQVAANRASLAQAEGTLLTAGQQLAVLVGQTLQSLDPARVAPRLVAMPELGDPPPAGVPAELIENRPDIVAARRRIEAADRRIGAIIAEQLPQLRVEFLPGWQWFQTDARNTLPDGSSVGIPPAQGFVWTGSATLTVPIFDGLAVISRARTQRATLEQQIEELGDLVLNALIEVEGALVLERQERLRLTHLAEQLASAGDGVRASRERYRSGLSDFLPVLTALQSQQSTELQILDARRQLVSQRIQLHRALGGSWPARLPAPEPSDVRSGEVLTTQEEPAQ